MGRNPVSSLGGCSGRLTERLGAAQYRLRAGKRLGDGFPVFGRRVLPGGISVTVSAENAPSGIGTHDHAAGFGSTLDDPAQHLG